jgi:hypothetical protein
MGIKALQRNHGRTGMAYNKDFNAATKTTGTINFLMLYIWKTIIQNKGFSGTIAITCNSSNYS